MMCTEQCQSRKCLDAGASSHAVAVTAIDGASVVKATRKLPTVGFPSLLRTFVPSGVTSTETIIRGAPGPDGARTADLRVQFHGAPASMHGTISILPDGEAVTRVVIQADLKAHVPLVAGKLKGFAAPIILGVIDAEERTAQVWAADRR